MAAPIHPNTKSGFYKARLKQCEACGAEYTAHRLTSRYCSDACRTQHGPWSFKAAHQPYDRPYLSPRE